jgi:hypothetical protein
MAEPPPEFHLGIIGGCMSHQRGTPLNTLYHRQLVVMLERDPGVRLRVHVARDFGLDYEARLNRLLSVRPIDGLLVHVREATITAAAKAFVRVSIDGRWRRRLNPAMLHRGHAAHAAPPTPNDDSPPGPHAHRPDAYADDDLADEVQDRPLPGRRIAGIRLRNVNYMLGALAGLGGWAIDDHLLMVDGLARACRERAVPLFVLGPTPSTYSYWAGRMARQANERLRRHLSVAGIPFALIEGTTDPEGNPLTRADGFHPSLACHRVVAEQLYEQGMLAWVGGIVAARRDASRPVDPR